MKTKGELTALRILDAACVCIAELGIERTSITAIAKRAKVSRALVAHHFPRKAELFGHVIRYIADEGYKSIEAAPAGTDEIGEIRHIVSANLDFFLDNPHFFRSFFLFYYYASFRKEFRRLNTQMQERAVGRFAEILTGIAKKGGSDFESKKVLETAERLERELIYGIQIYYVRVHEMPVERYKEHLLESVVGVAVEFSEQFAARR